MSKLGYFIGGAVVGALGTAALVYAFSDDDNYGSLDYDSSHDNGDEVDEDTTLLNTDNPQTEIVNAD